jgi:GntR family transcriptional regulator
MSQHVITSKAKSIPVQSEAAQLSLSGQVRESLRKSIHAGEWVTGDRLPSESELLRSHRVSRITVRRALADLAGEGLIVRLQGKGSFVAPGTVRQELSRLQGLTEALRNQGKVVRTQVLQWRRAQPDALTRAILGLPSKSTCMELQTLRFVDEQALSINHIWMVPSVAKGLTTDALMNSDLLTLYESMKGIRLARASVEITSTLASAEQGERLGLKVPAAVLQVQRTVYTFDDQVLHHECSVYNPTMFRYQIELAR